MKCIGILAPMWVEAELLHSQMTVVEELEYAGVKYYKGKLGDTEVVLSTCGVSKVNAAIFTQIMIDRFDVDGIIHTGVAGSMDDGVKHLSVVVANSLTFYDVDPVQLRDCFPHQEIFFTDEELTNLLLRDAGLDVQKGMIITGDDFISEKQKKAALKARFPKALCVEMESCAVANAAFVNQIPFAVVRCISDLADNSAALDYEDYERMAADKAAQMVIKALTAL